MFNWTISDSQQYLELFNFVDLHLIELLEIGLFENLTVCVHKICLQIIYLIYL